ncbi:MAG: vanadium-dependent haloperoxidase, partial [Actinomycetota bacterium]|nr:vanadium-dependent haloperoxidase [Actinomycetota bacterium]
DAAQLAYDRPVPVNAGNGEDVDYPFVARYSKGLPHDGLGVVLPTAHEALLAALTSGDPARFEAIPLGGVRPLTNPQAGKAFDLEGPDCHALAMRPAPRIDSPEHSAEMAELYWMALLRDVSFTDFGSNPGVAAAASDLSRLSDFRAPKQRGKVTAKTVFRGNTIGDRIGPFVSQFLLKDIPYGSLLISQRQETTVPGSDYLTGYQDWLSVQNGSLPRPPRLDSTRRYIRNMRDLTHYVHVDALYEAYLNACLMLLAMNAPVDPGNPYVRSRNQQGFGTFGGPHVLSLVTEVATRALKAVWFQKWYIHRRLRPEEFGGRVHNHLRGAASYPINPEVLNSAAVQATNTRQGSYLLSTAFPEGAPTHPAYGSGHATVAGACVTILKAWFDETFVLPSPVVANRDGTALVPYGGSDAGQMTVGGELNKVAANIAGGRNMAGIHWRSDYWEGVRLGEQVAVGVLQEQKATYNEAHSFSFTGFDGNQVTI